MAGKPLVTVCVEGGVVTACAAWPADSADVLVIDWDNCEDIQAAKDTLRAVKAETRLPRDIRAELSRELERLIKG